MRDPGNEVGPSAAVFPSHQAHGHLNGQSSTAAGKRPVWRRDFGGGLDKESIVTKKIFSCGTV